MSVTAVIWPGAEAAWVELASIGTGAIRPEAREAARERGEPRAGLEPGAPMFSEACAVGSL